MVAFHHRVDELHDHDGLADACAAEHGSLPSLRERSEKVDDLDAGFEYCGGRASVFEWRGCSVDGRSRHIGRQRRAVVADVAGDVEETTENRIADRHGDRMSGRAHRHSAFESGGGLQRDAAHGSLVEMCLNLDDEDSGLIPFDDERFFKPRKFGGFKGDVDHRSAYGEDLSSRLRGLRHRDDRSCFRTGFLQNIAIQAWCERFDL